MSAPVLTFFNNKGGVGKTSLVYHLAWMLADFGQSVLAVDLDPQANLTAAFLDEEQLVRLWEEPAAEAASTVYQCVQPLIQVGDIREPALEQIMPELHLVPGDLALSGFEDGLASEWPNCLRSENLYRPFRIQTAFWQVIQMGAAQCEADVILVDVGPSLGAINRAALIATDFVVVPLAADLFSRQGLRNLGPTLRQRREEWRRRWEHWSPPEFDLPAGGMRPLGYLIQQPIIRLKRPVQAYDRWAQQMPVEYSDSVLDEHPPKSADWSNDRNQIAIVKHYRSLVPLAQEARKPIFHLAAADGALGSHATAAHDAGDDFAKLAKEILRRMEAAMAEQRGAGA